MKPDGDGNQAEGKAGQPRHQCRSKSRREKIAMFRTLSSIDSPHLLVSDFAAAGLKQIYVVRIFSGCSNPQRYFVIALNSSTGPALLARQRADCLFETVLNMVVDQYLLGLRNGLLSTAWDCWATSTHGRCVSIMSMMPRK